MGSRWRGRSRWWRGRTLEAIVSMDRYIATTIAPHALPGSRLSDRAGCQVRDDRRGRAAGARAGVRRACRSRARTGAVRGRGEPRLTLDAHIRAVAPGTPQADSAAQLVVILTEPG